MSFRKARPADGARWQAFLEATASGDFLHDWEWASVAAFDGQPQRRFVLEDGDMVVGIAAAQVRPLSGGRSFWYVPHGPVLDYGHPDASARLGAVAEGLHAAAKEAGGIAIKLEPRLSADDPAVAHFGGRSGVRATADTLQVGQTRVIALRPDDELLAAFDKDTRYAVRRAEREGVTVTSATDAADERPIDELHGLVEATQRRAGFPMPALERYRLAWRALGGAGRAVILEARREGTLLASGMLVLEGDRSFYLFSGSLREAPGEPKRYASYALQWAMMRLARERGVRVHDLWGVAPPGAGPEHPWHGVGLFKKGFGGDELRWAGSWDVVVDPLTYRLRGIAGTARRWLRRWRR